MRHITRTALMVAMTSAFVGPDSRTAQAVVVPTAMPALDDWEDRYEDWQEYQEERREAWEDYQEDLRDAREDAYRKAYKHRKHGLHGHHRRLVIPRYRYAPPAFGYPAYPGAYGVYGPGYYGNPYNTGFHLRVGPLVGVDVW